MASPAHASDRTAKARIRDAAIARFARDGIGATSIKDIAADAGVSSTLVIHHFSSKDGLRRACDHHVSAVIRERKNAAMAEGTTLDPFEAMRTYDDVGPLFAYLTRTLADNSPQVAELVDELVDDAVQYSQVAIEQGIMTPTNNLRERTVVLTLWQLGAMVLHDHAKRLLGIDIVDGDAEDRAHWGLLAGDVLAGVIEPSFAETIRGIASRDSGVEATRPDPPSSTANA